MLRLLSKARKDFRPLELSGRLAGLLRFVSKDMEDYKQIESGWRLTDQLKLLNKDEKGGRLAGLGNE